MILVIANNDLDLLALRAAVESLPDGFPPVRALGGVGLGPDTPVPDLDGARAVLVRLHKGRSAWEHQLDELAPTASPPASPCSPSAARPSIDAELTALSTVPAGIVTEAAAYLARGGPANLANLLRFVADTVLLEGFGFEPPQDLPMSGLVGDRARAPGRPTVAVVTYRANVLAGNTLPVEQLCDAIEAPGRQRPGRLLLLAAQRPGRALDLLRDADVVVTTTWAAGGTVHEGDAATATSDGEGWASPLDALGVPVLQAVASTGATDTWAHATAGLSPLDVTLGVAIPEFDGRIIGPAAVVQGGRRRRRRARRGPGRPPGRPRPGRARRRPRRPPGPPPSPDTADKRVARRALRLPHQAQPHRQRRRPRHPPACCASSTPWPRPATRSTRCPRTPTPSWPAWPTASPTTTPPHPGPAGHGRRPPARRRLRRVVRHPARRAAHSDRGDWGPAPGKVCVHDDHLVFAGLDLGHVVVAIQPPRGLRRGPDRHVPHPRPAGPPPLPGLLPVARRRLRRRRPRPHGQARHPRVAAGQGRRPVGGLHARRRPRRPPAALPVRRQRPRRGHAGQAPHPRRRRRPPAPAHDPGRDLRRPRPGRAPARRVRQDRVARPGQAARHPGPAVGPAGHLRAGPRPRRRGACPTPTTSPG